MNKISQRTCMGCNTKKEKKELIRIVKNNQNEISIDKTGKQDGRGAYICNNIDCLKKTIKSRRIEKSLDMKINDEIYNYLEKLINGGELHG